MNKPLALILAVAAFGIMAPAGVAYADPPWERGNHDGKDNDRHERNHERHADYGRGKIAFHDEDRVYIREYIGHEYREHCPPGLAKKHNGCRPPGHAKHYTIGRPLDAVVVYEEVPEPLLVRLQPVPAGYRYVMVDRDVLLISEASKKVIDAVTLLSAVGH